MPEPEGKSRKIVDLIESGEWPRRGYVPTRELPPTQAQRRAQGLTPPLQYEPWPFQKIKIFDEDNQIERTLILDIDNVVYDEHGKAVADFHPQTGEFTMRYSGIWEWPETINQRWGEFMRRKVEKKRQEWPAAEFPEAKTVARAVAKAVEKPAPRDIAGGIPAMLANPPSPQETMESLLAPINIFVEYFGGEEYFAKPFAVTALSPFYKVDGKSAMLYLFKKTVSPSMFPEGEMRKAYEEWDAPWGLKGLTELLAWIAIGEIFGVFRPLKPILKSKPIFKRAEPILAKLLKGKKITAREGLILKEANKLAKKETAEFGRFLRQRYGIKTAETKPTFLRPTEPITATVKPTAVEPTAVKPITPEVSPTAVAKAATESPMPSITHLIEANYQPNAMFRIGQKLVNMPGVIGRINRALLAMQAAKTLPEKAVIAWRALKEDVAPSLANLETAVIRANDVPFRFAPPLYKKGTIPIKPVVEGMVTNVTPKVAGRKPFILDILEFPEKYVLTEAQRAEIDLIEGILRRQLEREMAVGLKVLPVRLKPGQRYFPRFIKELVDLENKAITEIRKGMSTRPGVRPGFFKDRFYDEVLDGIAAGKRYSTDYRAAVEMRLSAGNKAIADKQLSDFLAPFGKLPVERMNLAIKSRYWAATKQFAGIKRIKKVINSAIRGEKIPEVTLKAQEARFPELGAELRAALRHRKPELRKAALRKVLNKAKALEPALQHEYRIARREAQKELRLARQPILGKEGIINHAALQGRIFPIDIAEPTNKLIAGAVSPTGVLNTLAKINAVARMGQTAIDVGPAFIQGLLTLAAYPRAWGKAFSMMLKTLINPKYMARYTVMRRPIRLEMIKHEAAEFAATEFTEATRRGGWLLKIPGVGKVFQRFGTAFEALLDVARTEIYSLLKSHHTHKLGRELTHAEITDLVTIADHMVGIASMNRLGISKYTQSLIGNTLYAQRYYLSFVSLLARAFQGGIGAGEVRKAIAKLLVAMPAFMSAIAYFLGQKDRIIPTEDRPIPKMFDPRTGEFMTVEIGGTHVGLGGIWVAAFRLLASIVKTATDNPEDFASIDPHENPVLRGGYGRSSPVLGGIIDIATGRNYLGERVTRTPDDFLRLIVDRTFPFWLAGAITDVPKAGWQKGMAEFWGLRAWMVNYHEQAKRYAESHIKDIPREMIMPWQQEQINSGKELKYEDLNNEQRGWLLLNFEDYREAEEKRLGFKLGKSSDFEIADAKAREILDAAYEADIEELARNVLIGNITIADYIEQSTYLRRARAGEYQYRATIKQYVDEEKWEDLEKWIEENTKPEDKLYNEYMELRANPPTTGGVPQWDKWKLQLQTFMNSLDLKTQEYIERRRRQWIDRLPPNAQKVQRLVDACQDGLDDYYALPQGAPRNAYREAYPDVDAKLYILGRVSTTRTLEANTIVNELRRKYLH